MKRIELLAPAKDLMSGKIAIDYGADAVYIGAERFGARSGATNTMNDVRELAQYAHLFGAKLYVTMNTIIYDNELDQARQQAIEAWKAGADALIVQDMAMLEMDLPPIEMHASTQTFALRADRVNFLANSGFARVILERAISLEEIREIRKHTDVELEAFVHGAICVGFSGQCYFSQTMMGRSGNRGQCAQPCRWTYNLLDENYNRLIEDKHLLSVRDLDMSEYVEQMIDAGITSFKVEGRLKDENYVKNTVAYYRKRIDSVIARRDDCQRSSFGNSVVGFEPAPEKTFARGFTDWFISGKMGKVAEFNTPKATGRRVGKVRKVLGKSFELDGDVVLHSGDGICFLDGEGNFSGTNINRVAGRMVEPNRIDGIKVGTEIYRNFDKAFADMLGRDVTKRKLDVVLTMNCRVGQVVLSAEDSRGNRAEICSEPITDVAKNRERMLAAINSQLSKSGDTPFVIKDINVVCNGEMPFLTAAQLNDLRRSVLNKLEECIVKNYVRTERKPAESVVDYPEKILDFRANVVNKLSENFYRKRGVTEIQPGYELLEDNVGAVVMTSRYCIRRECGMCLKNPKTKCRGKLFIENNFHTFELKFDCANCEMSLVYGGSRKN